MAAILRTEEIVPGEDGIKKEVYLEGEGDLPKAGDEIKAHYTGRLLDGTEFDSSHKRPGTFNFVLGQGRVIKGWDQGFATMRRGEKAFLTCGPSYAYGAGGSPPTIPPAATLRFEVELVGFGPKAKEDWELSDAERTAAGEAAKEEGNAAFARGDLGAAAQAYDAAWGKVSSLGSAESAALRCAIKLNSAAVALKRRDFKKAAAEADTAVLINSSNAKAHFRLACAQAELGDFAAAKRALVTAAKLAPSDKAIHAEYARVKQLDEKARAVSAGAFRGLFTKRGGKLDLGSGEEGGAGGAGAGGVGAGEEDSEEGEEGEEGEGGEGKAGEEEAAAAAAAAAAAGAAGAPGEEKLDD